MPAIKLTSRTFEPEYKNQREVLGQTPLRVQKNPCVGITTATETGATRQGRSALGWKLQGGEQPGGEEAGAPRMVGVTWTVASAPGAPRG